MVVVRLDGSRNGRCDVLERLNDDDGGITMWMNEEIRPEAETKSGSSKNLVRDGMGLRGEEVDG